MNALHRPRLLAGPVTTIKIALMLSGVFAIPAGFSFAHAIGQSLNQTVGDFIVDIGYDSITPSPVAGEATSFDIRFFKNPGQDPADYSDVGIDITASDASTVFYSDIRHQSDSPTGMVYVFPKGDNYKLTAYYKKDGKTLAQASFPLQVIAADYEQPPQSPKKYWTNFISGAIVGTIFLGLVITLRDYFLSKKNKK